MTFAFNPTNMINTALCVIILLMGFWGKKFTTILIGIAFGLFGLSHVLVMFGMEQVLMSFLIIIRMLAYIMMVFVLYRLLVKS